MKNQDRAIPRPEHPRPQFERADWINLNGEWTFQFDHGGSGRERGCAESRGFGKTIIIPFCPESALSGVGYTDFIRHLWYHRTIAVAAAWQGRSTVLHFGGVDYACEVFIDGKPAGRHTGGMSSFELDITALVKPGTTHHLVVAVHDDIRSGLQPSGKQSAGFHSAGCHYTRTTGIWQTVWLEAVHPQGIRDVHIVPDIDRQVLTVIPTFGSVCRGSRLRVTVSAENKVVAQEEFPALDNSPCAVAIPDARLWSPQDPFLYDIRLDVCDNKGTAVDTVRSYAGMRKVHIEGNRILLNNQPHYLRLVLDQGFYPDGIWTAPSDTALKHDIELSMAAGFNGARLHQKVFEERFHYWADRLGYLTWGESPSWGFDMSSKTAGYDFMNQWREVVCRDRNHPSIIAWTPFNETGTQIDKAPHDRDLVLQTYALTKALDPGRPVNDCSGWVHVKTDLWTVHDYAQNGQDLFNNLKIDEQNGVMRNHPKLEPAYEGQPYLVDEFGGIKWIAADRRPNAENSWGYGNAPQSIEEFCERLESQVKALAAQEHICGWCYTQLTDVEQEQNGIYNYDRTEKFDMKRIARIFRGAC